MIYHLKGVWQMNRNKKVELSEEMIEDIDYLIDTMLVKIDISIWKYQFEEENLASTPYNPKDKIRL